MQDCIESADSTEFSDNDLYQVISGLAAIAEHNAVAAENAGIHDYQLERVKKHARQVRSAANRLQSITPNSSVDAVTELLGNDKELAGYLNNDAKIRFCNAFSEMWLHYPVCRACRLYLKVGDGDLCDTGKAIIVKELGSGL